MANKTNKMFTSRIKLTKNGKMKTRSLNQCHYNARERNAAKMAKKGMNDLTLTSKAIQQNMPHAKTVS